jgi:hypothetical protein
MQPTPRDAVRRVLTTAGITGAALTLTAAAAVPAFACHGGQTDDSSSHQQANKTKHGSDKSTANDDGHNPPGNNGTVFIHQVAGDSHPHNQPHVTCTFFVSLFGFDKGQALSASFAGQAPTGKGIALPVTDGTPTSTTSTTDAGGAGHDFDGDLGPFTATSLDVADKLGAPAKQGWHIKLTVSTGQGGGHKYKVFWLAPCAQSTPTSPTGPSVGGTETGGTETGGVQTGGTQSGSTTGGATIEGSTVTAQPATGTTTGGAQVLGEHLTRTAPGAQVLGSSTTRATSLPFTGTEIGLMSAAGAAAIGGGVALTVAGRRRRRMAAVR